MSTSGAGRATTAGETRLYIYNRILEKANFKFAHKKHTACEYEGVSSTVAYEAKRERGASHTRVSTTTTLETLTRVPEPRDTLAGYTVALRTGTVTFFIASAGSADIAVLRKALESSPIAQAIVM